MVVFPNETERYRTARADLLEAEKALRAQAEEVAALRRALPPGGEIPQDYGFTALDGDRVPLSALFGDHDQLLVYSLMFGPGWDKPCASCTSIVDALAGQAAHIGGRASIAVVSSASPMQLRTLSASRGWGRVPIFSAQGTSYQEDYHGRRGETELPMLNVFERADGTVRHFWGSELLFADSPWEPRHVDLLWPLWGALDLTRTGRGDFDPAETADL